MSEREGVEQTPDIEALAEWLGDMDESRNVFDCTDEATTVISIDVETLAARFADRLAAAVREARAAELREDLLEPWGPFEMGGFEGCTDQDPDRCACATDQQPSCEVCGQEIEPGEQAWSRQWPCYNTLPLDDPHQDWDLISWHNECPTDRADHIAVDAPEGGEDHRLALLRAVVSFVDTNGSDPPLTLLDQIRAEVGGPR